MTFLETKKSRSLVADMYLPRVERFEFLNIAPQGSHWRKARLRASVTSITGKTKHSSSIAISKRNVLRGESGEVWRPRCRTQVVLGEKGKRIKEHI